MSRFNKKCSLNTFLCNLSNNKINVKFKIHVVERKFFVYRESREINALIFFPAYLFHSRECHGKNIIAEMIQNMINVKKLRELQISE